MERMLSRGRDDDNEDVIRHRLEVYRDKTAPLIEHYRNQDLLIAVDAQGSIDAITARIEKALTGG